jgi:4-amino-4-deoxy-L-arabinose transferase-like glycosyltransferase
MPPDGVLSSGTASIRLIRSTRWFGMRASNTTRLAVGVLLCFIAVAVGAHFILLDADFPKGLTWSRVLYTDEGWYSGGAIARATTGRWYVEGDLNVIVGMPVLHLVEGAVFRIAGMSLVSARATIACFFVALLPLAYLLVSRHTNVLGGLAAIAVLSGSFIVFAYSRLATADLPAACLVLLSLVLAAHSGRRASLARSALSGLVFSVAVLTKATAVAALPALIYATWISGESRRQRVAASATVVAVAVGVVAAHYGAARLLFAPDLGCLAVFHQPQRFELNPLYALRNLWPTVRLWAVVDSILCPVVVVLVPVFFVVSRQFRQNKAAAISLVWLAGHILMISASTYQPPRYLAAAVIPATALLGVMAGVLTRRRDRLTPLLIVLAVGLLVFTDAGRMVRYLRSPSHTFLHMARDVASRMSSRPGEPPYLLGNFANSISLATGVRSINDRYGTRDLEWKLAEYEPSYYVTLWPEGKIANLIRETHELEPLAVYAGFREAEEVHFYAITEKASPDSMRRAGPVEAVPVRQEMGHATSTAR